MRDSLDELIRDRWLVSVAFGVAVGWTLVQFAHGVVTTLQMLTVNYSGITSADIADTSWLTFDLGDHVLDLNPVVWGAVQFCVVLAVALLVLGRRGRVPAPR